MIKFGEAAVSEHRRTFLKTTLAMTAAAAVQAVAPRGAFAQAPASPAAKYTPAPMAFDPKKIKGLSEKILVSHYENNYLGAVRRLNAIAEQLGNLDFDKAPVFTINGLKREELIAMNSMILHEVYFATLGDANAPGKALADQIAKDFGSFERWKSEFVGMAKAEGGGSGWVILTYSPHDKRLVNAWAADHTTTVAGGEPILAIDMYEHAYQMDFGAKAAEYVTAFMNTLNWSHAEAAFGKRKV